MYLRSESLKISKRYSAQKLEAVAAVLRAISHPVRLEIIEYLEQSEPATVTDILSHVQVEQSVLSHHLTKLKDKGILASYRRGRNIMYSLELKQITKIFDCMESCGF